MEAMLVTEFIKGMGKGEGSRPGGNTKEDSWAEEEGPLWSLEGTPSWKESVLSSKGREFKGRKRKWSTVSNAFLGITEEAEGGRAGLGRYLRLIPMKRCGMGERGDHRG